MLSVTVEPELLVEFRSADEALHCPTAIRTRRHPLPRSELSISDPSTNRPHRATDPLRRFSSIQPVISGAHHRPRRGIGGTCDSRAISILRLHTREVRPSNEIRHRRVELFAPQPTPPHGQLSEHLPLPRVSFSQDRVAARHHGDFPSTAIGLRGRHRHIAGVNRALHQPRRATLVDTDLARNGIHRRGPSTVDQGSHGLQHQQKSALLGGDSVVDGRAARPVPGETEQEFSRPGRAHSDAAISRQTRSRSSDDLRPGNRSAAVTFAFAMRSTVAAHVRSPERSARYHPPTASFSSDLMTHIVCHSHAYDEVPQIARSRQPLDRPRLRPSRGHDEATLTQPLAPLNCYDAVLGRS